jgi:histidinol-phosphate/aromatic aminotransferase/cobyric acid decarboxylase-like protein
MELMSIALINLTSPCSVGAAAFSSSTSHTSPNTVKVAGLHTEYIPLHPETRLADLSRIDPAAAARCSFLLLNYPNNPTGAVADEAFWQGALQFCEQHDLLLIHDNPYVCQVGRVCCCSMEERHASPFCVLQHQVLQTRWHWLCKWPMIHSGAELVSCRIMPMVLSA